MLGVRGLGLSGAPGRNRQRLARLPGSLQASAWRYKGVLDKYKNVRICWPQENH